MAANSSEAFEPATAVAAQPDGLATASMVLGMAAFLPIPGPAAGLIAIIVGIASGRTDNEGRRMRHRHATIGITLGAASLALLATVCLVYFVVLGYPLPHIGRYHPSPHHDDGCVC
jgi:hypothetical protein